MSKRIRVSMPEYNLMTEKVCDFMEKKSRVIAWDDEVTPCYRFLHTYSEYILGKKKRGVSHSF